MDVSIIIVNYNTTILTINCIDSIYNHTQNCKFEIIVIDNASDDNSLDEKITNYSDITFIKNTSNFGFGYANNQGIKIANGEFVFLLNSDTLLLSDALSYFLQFMRIPTNTNVAVCGAQLINEAHLPATSYGNFPTLTGSFFALFLRYIFPHFYKNRLSIGVVNNDNMNKAVDLISGADMFIRKSVFEVVGHFDEDFFLYFEETELSYRIAKAGYISVLLPEVKIVHLEGASSKVNEYIISSDSFNYIKFDQYVKSRKLFYKKSYGKIKAAFFLPLDILFTFLKSISGKEVGSLGIKIKIILNA